MSDVDRFELNVGSTRAVFTNLGARLVELHLPDRWGRISDVVLGYDDLDIYRGEGRYVGATCGRFANRIGGAAFELDGITYQVDSNEGANQLHGGPSGFDSMVWSAEIDESSNSICFSTTSPDRDQGFPGKITSTVRYTLTRQSTDRATRDVVTLDLVMTAETDSATVINLAHHSYWNLAGHGSGSALGQLVQIHADSYTPVDHEIIPTGEIRPVTETAFDFRSPRPIGESGPVGADHGVYDHNWVLDRDGSGELRPAVTAVDPASGRRVRVETNQPGVQFYTGGHFNAGAGVAGKGGADYDRFAGYAIETQRFPNSPNKPQFPSARLDPGSVYSHQMRMSFDTV